MMLRNEFLNLKEEKKTRVKRLSVLKDAHEWMTNLSSMIVCRLPEDCLRSKDFRATQVRCLTAATATITLVCLFV